MTTSLSAQHNLLRSGLFAFALLIGSGAGAQERLLREGEITERAIIDALSPAKIDTPQRASQPGQPTTPTTQPLSAQDDQDLEVTNRGQTRGFKPAERTVSSMAQSSARHSAGLLITFATDSAELQPQARTALDTVANALQSNQMAQLQFVIEGHTDPRGSDEHNRELSLARAQSVMGYLLTKHQIDPKRLSAVGKGSSQLVNTQNPNASENRRVSIAVIQ